MEAYHVVTAIFSFRTVKKRRRLVEIPGNQTRGRGDRDHWAHGEWAARVLARGGDPRRDELADGDQACTYALTHEVVPPHRYLHTYDQMRLRLPTNPSMFIECFDLRMSPSATWVASNEEPLNIHAVNVLSRTDQAYIGFHLIRRRGGLYFPGGAQLDDGDAGPSMQDPMSSLLHPQREMTVTTTFHYLDLPGLSERDGIRTLHVSAERERHLHRISSRKDVYHALYIDVPVDLLILHYTGTQLRLPLHVET